MSQLVSKSESIITWSKSWRNNKKRCTVSSILLLLTLIRHNTICNFVDLTWCSGQHTYCLFWGKTDRQVYYISLATMSLPWHSFIAAFNIISTSKLATLTPVHIGKVQTWTNQRQELLYALGWSLGNFRAESMQSILWLILMNNLKKLIHQF